MTNIFQNAKKVEKVVKGKASDKAIVELKKLATYAVLADLEKSIKAMKETLRSEMDVEITEQFAKTGCATHNVPDNYRGIDKIDNISASASIELRQRSSASALNDAEVALLEANNIDYTVTENVPETFVINPAYANDSNLLTKVSEALSVIEGIPADFIQFQESIKKRVVTSESIAQVFKKDEETVKMLIPVVGTLAIKPKLEDNASPWAAIETIKNLFT